MQHIAQDVVDHISGYRGIWIGHRPADRQHMALSLQLGTLPGTWFERERVQAGIEAWDWITQKHEALLRERSRASRRESFLGEAPSRSRARNRETSSELGATGIEEAKEGEVDSDWVGARPDEERSETHVQMLRTSSSAAPSQSDASASPPDRRAVMRKSLQAIIRMLIE